MKWNDAWLSNKDCDRNNLLDRHYGFEKYVGSGAWCTNHQWGSYDIVDEFDIGDTESEEGHELTGWSFLWPWNETVATGGYGGKDDGTFRLLMGPGDGCGEDYKDAYFTMNAYCAVVNKLILRHLDGIANDDFSVYVQDGEEYTLIGSYTSDPNTTEFWETTEYNFSPRSGEIQFKLSVTGPIWGPCSTWGQVAFSWAKIESESPCYWDYFVKIVAAPADAELDGGIWYNADGIEIGPDIWGQFATIQVVSNDPCFGEQGIQYNSPVGPGFGQF
jgi:hypothetical protein